MCPTITFAVSRWSYHVSSLTVTAKGARTMGNFHGKTCEKMENWKRVMKRRSRLEGLYASISVITARY
ncbi:hypothetical protein JG688_00013210 [Phytophthora aleatoria]|uniref:Uncharacterized protein n=1 Tax=Phytophthora aleatoria TaxID=2496075 RepID=A0A8J5IA26_9STRA|nr:hypothetical protein JG688_00013210 [Phytophthora aleatoria]